MRIVDFADEDTQLAGEVVRDEDQGDLVEVSWQELAAGEMVLRVTPIRRTPPPAA